MEYLKVNYSLRNNLAILQKIANLLITQGGRGTPLYKIDRYVRCQRVWFSSCFSLKESVDFGRFGLK